jgi:hypothetical protein
LTPVKLCQYTRASLLPFQRDTGTRRFTLSDEQKKDTAEELKKKLGRPSNPPGPLPGLGQRPAAGLPGLSQKPGLPGLGGGLPGLGGKPGAMPMAGLPGQPAVVPPFMAPQAAPTPQQLEQDARDPFNAPMAVSTTRPSYMPRPSMADMVDTGPAVEPHKNRGQLLIGIAIIVTLGMLIGAGMVITFNGRTAVNVAIRDAMVVEFEYQKAFALAESMNSAFATAIAAAGKREYDPSHLAFIKENFHGNPIRKELFAERNYKSFDALAVQFMADYYQQWAKLSMLLDDHKRATENDLTELTAAKPAFQKLLAANYGVVFTRDDKQGGKLLANVVLMGAPEGDKIKVQTDSGTFGDERTLYSPEGEDSSLTKDPDKYVMELGSQSKTGLLSKATQSHFEAYARRLREISDTMKVMEETKNTLRDKLTAMISQEPVFFSACDALGDFEEYKAKHSGKAAEAAPAE